MKMDKMDKLDFLTTEMGIEMVGSVSRLYSVHRKLLKVEFGSCVCNACMRIESEELIRLEAFCLAFKQFYGVKYCFTHTGNFYGLATEDGADWLFKKPVY